MNNKEYQDVAACTNQSKNDIITQIKNLINEYGNFSTSEVNADHSPEVESSGNLTHLIEYFDCDYVEIYVYGEYDIDVDHYTLPYEDLSIENLEYILELCGDWKQLNLDNNG